jgi:DNA primase
MHRRTGRPPARLFTEEQIRRVILVSGATIEGEVGTDFLVFCPFHGNFRTPAGEVDKEKGTFFCFSCRHVCDLNDYITKVSGKTYFQAERLIKQMEQEMDITDILDKELEEKPEFVPFDELLIKRLHNDLDLRARTYLNLRLINDESIDRFMLGYSRKQDMITVPVSAPDGMWVGFVGRSLEGKQFKNTTGHWRSKTLFNLHKTRKYDQVYVVESSFDAIRLSQNGIPAVATLGASVSNIQLGLLEKYFSTVVVIGDNDDAGKLMKERVLTRLGNRAILITLPDRFKDVGDLTDSDIAQLNTKISDPLLSLSI